MSISQSQVALIVSALSVGIALFSLGWNVYRDIILKPIVKVRLQVGQLRTPGLAIDQSTPTKVYFAATNFGPGIVVLQGIRAKRKRFLRKTKHMILFNDFNDPLSHQFPHTLDVAARASFFVPFGKGIFLESDFTHIGITDSFGRIHWVPDKDIDIAKKAYDTKFGKGSSAEIE